jgi:hypothetical protein
MAGRSFRDDYSLFKAADTAVLAEKVGDYLPISERLVCCIWYTQAYLQNLRTVDGRAVQVISPGIWNLAEGPDFTHAALELDGDMARGDIEIHIRSSDWSGHLHHRESRYDNVIAHVFMWRDTDDPFLTTSSGKRIPQIELSQHLTRPLGRIIGQIETEDFPYNKKAGLGRCAELLAGLSKGQLRTLLSIAGEWRILEKSARYAEWLSEASQDKVLYRAFMEALGYPGNKEAFLILARRVPLEVLQSEARERFARSSHYAIQSVLMHLSGLLPEEPEAGWDAETKGYLDFMKGIWQDFTDRTSYFPMDAAKWNLRVRPLNAPLRRMAAASQWVYRHRNRSLFSSMVRILRDLREGDTEFGKDYERFKQEAAGRSPSHEKGDLRKRYLRAVSRLYGLFRCEEDKYWSYRYDLGSKKVSRPISLLGESRVQEIVVNVVIPILLLHFRNAAEEYESTLYLLYNFLPKLQENRVTRFMSHRLFGKRTRPIPLESAVTQQGLHQLFNDYCSKDRGGCLECTFQANLRKWLEHSGAARG